MKIKVTVLFTLIVCLISSPCFPESLRTIKLKDGSTLKAQVLQLADGVYTFKTSNLGEIHVEESKILSIEALPSLELKDTSSDQNSHNYSLNSSDLKNQIQQLQGEVMNDQEIMGEIQNLMANDDVMSLITDKDVMSDVLSFDEEKMRNNEKMKKLMNDPQMQDLMKKVNQKFYQKN